MPPKGWGTADQKAFIALWMAEFLVKKSAKNLDEFWGKMKEAWFLEFPEELELDLPVQNFDHDPNTDERPRALTPPEQVRLDAAIGGRIRQLRNSFFNGYAKIRTGRGGIRRSTSSLAAMLFKSHPKRRRRHQVLEVFQQDHAEKIQAALQASEYPQLNEAAQCRTEDGVWIDDCDDKVKTQRLQTARRRRMEVQRRVVQECWDVASEAVKEAVREKAKTEITVPDPDPDDDEQGERTPEEYQLSLDESMQVAEMFVTEFARMTGWVGALVYAGPVPRLGGDLGYKSVCFGLTPGGVNFQTFHSNWKKSVAGPLCKFARQAIPRETRIARAIFDGSAPVEQADSTVSPTSQAESASAPKEKSKSKSKKGKPARRPKAALPTQPVAATTPSSPSPTAVHPPLQAVFDDAAVFDGPVKTYQDFENNLQGDGNDLQRDGDDLQGEDGGQWEDDNGGMDLGETGPDDTAFSGGHGATYHRTLGESDDTAVVPSNFSFSDSSNNQRAQSDIFSSTFPSDPSSINSGSYRGQRDMFSPPFHPTLSLPGSSHRGRTDSFSSDDQDTFLVNAGSGFNFDLGDDDRSGGQSYEGSLFPPTDGDGRPEEDWSPFDYTRMPPPTVDEPIIYGFKPPAAIPRPTTFYGLSGAHVQINPPRPFDVTSLVVAFTVVVISAIFPIPILVGARSSTSFSTVPRTPRSGEACVDNFSTVARTTASGEAYLDTFSTLPRTAPSGEAYIETFTIVACVCLFAIACVCAAAAGTGGRGRGRGEGDTVQALLCAVGFLAPCGTASNPASLFASTCDTPSSSPPVANSTSRPMANPPKAPVVKLTPGAVAKKMAGVRAGKKKKKGGEGLVKRAVAQAQKASTTKKAAATKKAVAGPSGEADPGAEAQASGAAQPALVFTSTNINATRLRAEAVIEKGKATALAAERARNMKNYNPDGNYPIVCVPLPPGVERPKRTRLPSAKVAMTMAQKTADEEARIVASLNATSAKLKRRGAAMDKAEKDRAAKGAKAAAEDPGKRSAGVKRKADEENSAPHASMKRSKI
ncbi:hypothetical protein C8R46DRAFT_1212944 [Mycena filopes]|nr:hypothetical protein C8R46DRAFT_1212944 [Mycena filopes]